jgi:uncharacterized membrane protein
LYDFTNFTLEVMNINDPPKITTSQLINAQEDSLYQFEFEAMDIDNLQNDLSWVIRTNANWLVIDNGRAIVNGIPSNEDVGEYWINLTLSDGEFYDYSNLTLIVENTNDPPKIIVKDDLNATAGDLFSIRFRIEDIDPPPLTFIWSLHTNSSEWLSIDQFTGLLIGEPSDEDVGSYWVNVTVSDYEGGSDFHNFSLQINKKPTQNTTQDQDTSDDKGTPFYASETFFGIILIFMIIIILICIVLIFTLRKQKKEIIHIITEQRKEVIETVRAELLPTTPSHLALPGETAAKTETPTIAQPVVTDQLTDAEKPALPKTTEQTEEDPIPTVGTVPISQEFQLPKNTLSKEQQLNLLKERFLKGDVTEEAYNKLRAEIEGKSDESITDVNIEEDDVLKNNIETELNDE